MVDIEIKLTEWAADFLNEIEDAKDHKFITNRLVNLQLYGIQQALKIGDLELITNYSKLKMYEYKVHCKVEFRFLGTIRNKEYVLVHGFIKKNQKIRQKELELAAKRIKNLIFI